MDDRDLLERLSSRRQGIDLSFGNPVIQRIGNTLSRLPHFGGPPRRDDDDPIDLMIKMNQLQTSSPDFRMKEAQTRANMAIQQALDIDKAKSDLEAQKYRDALKEESPEIQPNHTQPVQAQYSTGTPTSPTSPKTPIDPSKIQRYVPIEEPGKREYDPKIGRFITKPGAIQMKESSEYENLGKPLTGESATKFSGAQQGRNSIEDIFNLLKISPTGTLGPDGTPEFKSDIPLPNRIVDKFQQGAAASNGLIFGKNVPILSDIMRTPQIFADDTARSTQLEYETLAEDLLRARTGANAPEPELVREFARSLNRLGDDPTVVARRLMNNLEFVDGMLEQIRPGYLESQNMTRGEVNFNRTPQPSGGFDQEKEARYQAWKASQGR